MKAPNRKFRLIGLFLIVLTIAYAATAGLVLSWTDNASNEDGFIIERSLTPGAGWAEVARVGPNITNYADIGLPLATLFYYRVRAYNTAGASLPSNVASAMTETNVPIVTVPNAPSAAKISKLPVVP